MSMLLLLVFLIGAVLGTRFKVLVLIPAIGLTVSAILAAGIVRGESISTFAVTAILAVSCLQIGYLSGIATHYIAALGHSGRRRGDARKTTPSPAAAPRHSIGGPPSTAYRG